MTYLEWIETNVTKPYGRCAEYTLKMIAQFPELTRVRGHYYCPVWGKREHWWLQTPDGEVIDPTAGQFPSKGRGPYVLLPSNAPEPNGMCPNCGEYIYAPQSGVCSEKCAQEFMAYLNNEGKW